jgi:hypothetical protein
MLLAESITQDVVTALVIELNCLPKNRRLANLPIFFPVFLPLNGGGVFTLVATITVM